MRSDAGSPADLPCPQCRSTQAKVALSTQSAVFFRCSHCKHAWSVPKARPGSDTTEMYCRPGGSEADRGPAGEPHRTIDGSD
jgi:hypothetical protein